MPAAVPAPLPRYFTLLLWNPRFRQQPARQWDSPGGLNGGSQICCWCQSLSLHHFRLSPEQQQGSLSLLPQALPTSSLT